MGKIKFLILANLFPFVSHGAMISFVGPCSEEPLVATEAPLESVSNVGQFTVKVLTQKKIDYIGSELGMNSIFNTPTDTEAYEIISKSEMMAYGWCYSVNGVEPNEYPDKISIKETDEILWWFGYAHYLEGEWISQCEPSYKRKPAFLCQ